MEKQIEGIQDKSENIKLEVCETAVDFFLVILISSIDDANPATGAADGDSFIVIGPGERTYQFPICCLLM